MEVRILTKEKDLIEIELQGVNETVLEPLKQKLLQDDNVTQATYYMGHPMLARPRLRVRVKEGKPHAALKKASKAIASEFREAQTLIEKAKRPKA
ncbi:MAG: DNA-directed RNA polymerase subunit L [Euryarchaeota archaeon]|nr:DNA-directed RNA polymerase subunit L [Euryarchaeota archaeon]